MVRNAASHKNVPAAKRAAGRRRRRDKQLYAHDPGKLNEVDALLKEFAGRGATSPGGHGEVLPDDVDRFARIVKLFSEDADVNRMLGALMRTPRPRASRNDG